MRLSRTIVVAGKLLVSVGLLGYLFYISDLDLFVEAVAKLSLLFVATAWAAYTLITGISAYRWQLLLAAKGIHVPLRTLFSFYMVGMFFNNFLPGAVGGDVAKSWDLYRYSSRGGEAVASVFLDRFCGLVGLTILGFAGMITTLHVHDSPLIRWSVVGSIAFLLAVITLLWFAPAADMVTRILRTLPGKSIGARLESLYAALHAFGEHKQVLLVVVLISFALQVGLAAYYAMFSAHLGAGASFVHFVLFLPAVTIVSMVPISFGGLGVREAAMILLFNEVGVASAEVLSISISVFVVNTLFSLWGGLILLLRKPVAGQPQAPQAPGE